MRNTTLEAVMERTPAVALASIWTLMAFAVLIEQGQGNAFIYFALLTRHAPMQRRRAKARCRAGLRKTAADRPGQAQPVPTRDIPTRPWAQMGVAAFVARRDRC